MNCDSCSRTLNPRAGPDDLEHPQWTIKRDASASDGTLTICHVCDAASWDDDVYRRKAEKRPFYVATLDEWNAAHPLGTRVRYHPVRKVNDELLDEGARETFTRSEAWDIGTPTRPALLVLVAGVAGGVSIYHLIALDDDRDVETFKPGHPRVSDAEPGRGSS